MCRGERCCRSNNDVLNLQYHHQIWFNLLLLWLPFSSISPNSIFSLSFFDAIWLLSKNFFTLMKKLAISASLPVSTNIKKKKRVLKYPLTALADFALRYLLLLKFSSIRKVPKIVKRKKLNFRKYVLSCLVVIKEPISQDFLHFHGFFPVFAAFFRPKQHRWQIIFHYIKSLFNDQQRDLCLKEHELDVSKYTSCS